MRRTRSTTVMTMAAAVAVTLHAPASATIGDQGPPPATIAVGERPESVTRAWEGRFFVSVQGAPDAGLGDGEIRSVNPRTGAVRTFVSGLDNPRGITFTGDRLVVTDTDRIWLIDRAGRKKLLTTANRFPHAAAFLSDVAPAPGGNAVHVAEMGARTLSRDANGVLWPLDSPMAQRIPAEARVYRVSFAGDVREVVPPGRDALIINGVATGRRPGQVVVGDMFYGNIVTVDIVSGRRTLVASGYRGADGVEQGHDGSYYVSSYDQGVIWRLDRDGGHARVLYRGAGTGSTADFHLDERNRRLLVADTAGGRVVVVPTGS
ncbi:hypothetical protein ACQPZF_26360 [Actinosynnema sp. CS-041913]|uniref:SMP-30/gluconolactonase/LRE family protein n=1 Tax=Actinosynnema sp. CS-041913 TaxID=3239917 RepID=UPI003D9146B2